MTSNAFRTRFQPTFLSFQRPTYGLGVPIPYNPWALERPLEDGLHAARRMGSISTELLSARPRISIKAAWSAGDARLDRAAAAEMRRKRQEEEVVSTTSMALIYQTCDPMGDAVEGVVSTTPTVQLNQAAKTMIGSAIEVVPTTPTARRRRNLTTNERALIAAKMAGLANGSNRFEKKARDIGDVETSPTVSLYQAAELMGVSRDTVVSAKTILDHGTETDIAAAKWMVPKHLPRLGARRGTLL